MAANDATRGRAYSLRKKVKAGKLLSAAEKAWLDDYSRSAKARNAIKPGESRREEPRMSDAPQTVAAAESRAIDTANQVPIAFEGEGGILTTPDHANDTAKPATTGGTCNIPDCTACKKPVGAVMTCGVTGQTVYPAMSLESANFLAEMFLNLLSAAAKMLRKDSFYVKPDKHDIKTLGAGIREMQIRRASWFSAIDDLVLVFGAIGTHGTRALTEDPPKPKELAA